MSRNLRLASSDDKLPDESSPSSRHLSDIAAASPKDRVEVPARVQFRAAPAVMSANNGGYFSLRRVASVETHLQIISGPFSAALISRLRRESNRPDPADLNQRSNGAS